MTSAIWPSKYLGDENETLRDNMRVSQPRFKILQLASFAPFTFGLSSEHKHINAKVNS
jgi:hypothetical protein